MMQDLFLSFFTKNWVCDLPGRLIFKYSLTHNPCGAAYGAAEQVHDPWDTLENAEPWREGLQPHLSGNLWHLRLHTSREGLLSFQGRCTSIIFVRCVCVSPRYYSD